jgi:ubiquinone/menaquinone biosynthesis C-methylase UbiE
MQDNDIFDPNFVKGVFDRCGPNYRYWSQIASFGFVWLWRKQCVQLLPLKINDGASIYDLMAGTGETWGLLLKRYSALNKIIALDISETMVKNAIERLHKMRATKIEVREADVLKQTALPASADVMISSFGLKTFNQEQQAGIAKFVAATLKSGGAFSFVEASDPHGWWFRPQYRFYMCRVLPFIERLFLNGAQDFAMIGDYTAAFVDCSHFASCLRDEGLTVQYRKLFFGCASVVYGEKPLSASAVLID